MQLTLFKQIDIAGRLSVYFQLPIQLYSSRLYKSSLRALATLYTPESRVSRNCCAIKFTEMNIIVPKERFLSELFVHSWDTL